MKPKNASEQYAAAPDNNPGGQEPRSSENEANTRLTEQGQSQAVEQNALAGSGGSGQQPSPAQNTQTASSPQATPQDDNSIPPPQHPQQQPPSAAPTSTPPQPLPPAPQTQHGDAPQIADDVDLIEQEWVDKAKEIVERTKTDPYLQSQEINKMKAAYLKKRYNKDIKLDENS